MPLLRLCRNMINYPSAQMKHWFLEKPPHRTKKQLTTRMRCCTVKEGSGKWQSAYWIISTPLQTPSTQWQLPQAPLLTPSTQWQLPQAIACWKKWPAHREYWASLSSHPSVNARVQQTLPEQIKFPIYILENS